MSDKPNAKILIVDDETPQMEALRNTLQDEGYATTGFSSAKEALSALQSRRFDLLLTDLMMPGMDGIALLQAARKIDGNLASVVMTGHGTIDTAVQAMKAGALDYILKPFDLTVVLPVLSRALTMRRLKMENAELSKRVLDHAIELEFANKDLEAFSYSVSHDLRAPLRSIQGYSNVLLEEGGLSERQQALLQKMSAGTVYMTELIEGLLNLAGLARQPVSKQPLNISLLAKQALEGLEEERKKTQAKVLIGEMPDCTGDASMLKQVYVNLLTNAFKSTRGKEHAVVEAGCEKQNGENVYFIRDNGIGFDMQFAHKLFQAFQRLHQQNEFEGTGVGLSIVHRVIHRHGGKVWAEGKVGQGATFYFTLPGPN